ncbi:hypothetical protein BGZ65_002447, partial [Modicella reniformis]
MARKKHALDDDYSSSDDEPHDRGVTQRDLEHEMERFRDPMHMNQRKRTKEEATYGVFYDWESEDEGSTSKPGGARSRVRRREEFNFVPAGSANSQKKAQTLAFGDENMDSEGGQRGRRPDYSDDGSDNQGDMDVDNEDEDKDEDNGEDGDEDEEERKARRAREAAFKTQRQRDQEDVDAYEDRVQRPQMDSKPGIGLGVSASSLSFFKNRVNLSDVGSGSPSLRPSSPASVSSPRRDVPMVAPVKVDKDYGAFSAKGSGFGLKILEKMGWKKGYGLGAGGAGIVEPIQTKLRPVKMGIGYKGFKEKTDQTRAEEKRRGVAVSSDEEEKPTKRTSKSGDRKEGPKADGWKTSSSRGPKKGPKVEYKTAEEIQREIESGDLPMAPVQPQKILDMTGKTVRELSSASQISSSVPFEHERFPELRHNLQLMADISTIDLEQLARLQKTDNVRLKVLEAEGSRIQKLVAQDEINLERMTNVLAITDKCSQIASEIRQTTNNTTGVDVISINEDYIIKAFQAPFDLFLGLYFEEYELYQLDQVVIAVAQDSFKTLLKDWDVLKNPTLGARPFQKWKKLLRMSKVVYNNDRSVGGFYGGKPSQPEQMTAYESLLNHHWLPKVRSALNNEWDP